MNHLSSVRTSQDLSWSLYPVSGSTNGIEECSDSTMANPKAHFHALAIDGGPVGENPARYVVARSVDDLLTEAAYSLPRSLRVKSA